MRQVPFWLAVVASVVLIDAGGIARVSAEQKDPSASGGSISLPATGAASTRAYAVVDNPTMYAFYVTKASCDVAGSVELRQTAKNETVTFMTVPAFGSLDMKAEGFHLLLKDLKRPLASGDKVRLTLGTDLGVDLTVDATVRKD